MNNIIITLNNKNYKRVNKTTARKLFNEGHTIGFIPCNANPHSAWTPVVFRDKHDPDCGNDLNFDKFVNSFEYYNCQYNELGKYTNFYVEV